MPRFYFVVFLAAGLLAGSALPTLAQQNNPTISGDFRGIRFEEFARRVEAQTPYRFYFKTATLDTVTVHVQVDNLRLLALLSQVFSHTSLQFAIDEATNRVFVTPERPLQTQVPKGVFQTLPPGAAPAPDLAIAPVRPSGPPATGTSEFRVYEIGPRQATPAGGRATLTGTVRTGGATAPVLGAAVFIDSPNIGTATDKLGNYSLTIPVGRHNLNIRGLGIRSTRRQLWVHGDGRLDLEVLADVTSLTEVVVQGQKDRNVRSMQMGVQKLDIKQIKQIPTVFGESDLLRVVTALPGVKTIGEGSTGFSVRGGGTDQNLVLFNGATIYNPAHLFGFFSAFNPDMVQSVELYKSAIPARYGGRLASVLDIVGREGSRKKFGASGGIGLLTSRLALEGPLAKGKGSFLVSGRTSYSDWLLKKVPSPTLKNSAASFYDLSAYLTYDFNPHNSLSATGYLSHDRFRLASDTVYEYRNAAASLKWKHDFNDKFYGTLLGTTSHYDFNLATTRNEFSASTFAYSLNQSSVQADLSYLVHPKHTLDFGASSLLYNTAPGDQLPAGDKSLLLPTNIQHERALESAVYASERFDVSPRFSVQAGLRYSFYQALGPRTVSEYIPGISRSVSTITGTTTYGQNQVFAHYNGPEWRLSGKFELTDNSSVKVSYNRMRQYIHQLSNTTVVSPTDTWKLSDGYIRPQVGDQVSLGYYRNFKRNTIEFSVETYYKKIHDFLDYKSGAVLLLNPRLETDLVNAEGKAYGVEVLLRKNTGKINGWLSYTYARSLVQVSTATDVVNGGAWYASNYDKPHDVTLVGNYRFSQRFSASLNMNYSTGRPITLPLAKYYIDNALRVYYSDRNAYRVPDYYRMDFALNIEGSHKIHKLAHSSWTISIYNVTGRRNPYSVYFQTVNGQLKGYKLSIFGEPIPTVTYNFRF
ncbi:TonB-dependent receptor [Hymenobacter sp. H14-R3]|uniref:TonB-dependent receptor n=1 Tax=Hymenobacter sp. H14-R3 TaxID=3046308 RepID=UPI0024B9568B|nr:carboxypeptidase-like regulatory domain-containing protein [Hymenobacter sp. H14-R3]MDJ0363802.1 TonB-dependent receptor [Hymenobacter sp. H14-R3]